MNHGYSVTIRIYCSHTFLQWYDEWASRLRTRICIRWFWSLLWTRWWIGSASVRSLDGRSYHRWTLRPPLHSFSPFHGLWNLVSGETVRGRGL